MADGPQGLAEQLAHLISDWPSGAHLPSVADLGREYSQSPYIVTQALKILEGRGLVAGSQGRPWTVLRPVLLEIPLERDASRLYNGQRPAVGADAWVYAVRSLGLEAQEGEPEVKVRPGYIEREMLRSVDGVPHNLARWRFPRQVADGTRLAEPGQVRGGTIPYLAEIGHGPDHYTLRFQTGMPSPAERLRLALPRGGVPVLVETRTGYQGDREVFQSEVLWRGDRSVLVVER